MSMKCGPRANYRYQRGAIGFTGILIMLTAVLLTAMLVDSGRLWVQQKKLQLIADMAAIHAARHIGCSADLQSVTQMAQLAAVRNGFTGQLSASPNQVLLGRLNTIQGVRQFTADGSNQAVFVRATEEVPSSLVAGGIFGGTVTLHAEAASISDPSLAILSVGSSTLTLNTQQSALLNGLLGGILGGPLTLDALTYRGIAATKLTLQDLLSVSEQIGTLDGLLNTEMLVGDALKLIANAVERTGTADIQVISGMQRIAAVTVKDATVKLGDVLALTSPSTEAAATLAINALSLITTTAMIANGVNAINLPLGINLPSLAQVNAQINIIEPPQLAIGPAAGNGTLCTVARSAQIRARVSVLVNIPLLARVDLALNAEVGRGSAGIRTIEHHADGSEVVVEASPGIAALSLTNNAGTGPARISALLGLPLADIGLNLPLQSSTPQMLEYSVPLPAHDHLPQTQSISSSVGSSLENALAQPDTLDITLLGILNLGIVNTVVATIVSPLLSMIGQTLLDPLLALLGITVGGLDVTLEDVEYRQAKPLML